MRAEQSWRGPIPGGTEFAGRQRDGRGQSTAVLPAPQQLETTVFSPFWGQCDNRTRIGTPSTHKHHWQQLGSPKSDPRGGTKSRLFPSRYSPTAGLPFGGDAKPLSCVPSTHTGNNWTRKGAGLPMDPGPRATQLPAPLPRGGNELQGNAAERCQNNFY